MIRNEIPSTITIHITTYYCFHSFLVAILQGSNQVVLGRFSNEEDAYKIVEKFDQALRFMGNSVQIHCMDVHRAEGETLESMWARAREEYYSNG